MSAAKPALDGIRVIDFTHFIAGPFCTMILADLGAEVLKVEGPGGDTFRRFRPQVGGEGAPFIWVNRNKSSVCIDLGSGDGRRIVGAMIERADCAGREFLNGRDEAPRSRLRDGRQDQPAARLLLDLGLRARGTPRGPRGLRSCHPGGDRLHVDERLSRQGPRAHGSGGHRHLLRHHGRECRARGPDGARAAGHRAVCRGGHVRCLRLHARVPRHELSRERHQSEPLRQYQPRQRAHGHVPRGRRPDLRRVRERRALPAWSRECSSGPNCWKGRKYADNATRVKHSGQLAAEINGTFAQDSREVWVEKLRAAGIPAGIARTVEGAFRSPEMAQRNLVTRIPHPTAGEVPNIASALQLSATPVVPPVAAPALGQHTAQVLRDLLGLSDARIASLAAGGAIATGKA